MNYLKAVISIVLGSFLAIALLSFLGNGEFVQLLLLGGIVGLLFYIAVKQ
ncbi:hypothetical protein V1502_10760 [Bacillus sp. SCS-153A]